MLAGLHLARGGIPVAEDDGHTPPLASARLPVDEFSRADAGRGLVRVGLDSGQTLLVNAAG